MRKVLLIVAALLLPCSIVQAQGIRYYPPAGGGGMADPGADGIMVRSGVDTSIAREITSSDGSNVVVNPDGLSGDIDITVDSSVWSRFQTATADASGNCYTGTYWLRTDTNEVWHCTATNTWTKLVKTAATLTADLPVIGVGTSEIAVGTRSGNTTAYVTTTGTQTSGDCVEIDANGNHIASGAACGGSATFDPGTTITLYEEFITGDGTTNNRAGTNGMYTAATGTGTLALVANPPDGNPGLIRILSHASNDNSGGGVAFGSTPGTAMNLSYYTGDWTLDAVIIPGSNGTSIAAAGFFVGLSNTIAADFSGAASLIGVRYNTDLGDATYIFVTCDTNASGCASAGDDTHQKVVASTVAPVAGTPNRIKIRRVASGVGAAPTIYMSVGAGGVMEAEKTFCAAGCDDDFTQVPTSGNLGFGVTYLTRTTTGVISGDVDYMYMTLTKTRY